MKKMYTNKKNCITMKKNIKKNVERKKFLIHKNLEKSIFKTFTTF